MVPMNFLRAGTTADYVDTGTWAVKAIEEAKRVGSVNVTGSTKDDQYSRIPTQAELQLSPAASAVHITTNNTIEERNGRRCLRSAMCRSWPTPRPTF